MIYFISQTCLKHEPSWVSKKSGHLNDAWPDQSSESDDKGRKSKEMSIMWVIIT